MKKSKKKPINLLTPIIFVYIFMALGLTYLLNTGLSTQKMTTQSKALSECPSNPPSEGCFPQSVFDTYSSKYSCRVIAGTTCDGVCAECDFNSPPGGTQSGNNQGSAPYNEPACSNAGGECQAGKLNEVGNACTLSDGAGGTVKSGLCPNQVSDIRCCVANAGNTQQPPQQGSQTCQALPKASDLTFNDVLPGKTSAINWPAIEGAVKYQIRLDDPANPWNGDCAKPEPGDLCDDNVTAQSPKTSITFSPGFQFREKQYRFWYHAVNSCGAVSESGEGFITVKQDSNPEITPTKEPQQSPVPQTSTAPQPSATPKLTPNPSVTPTLSITPNPKITPNEPLKFVPIPGDIPPLCPDISPEPDTILSKTIEGGAYMIQFAQAPTSGTSYGLLIDDLSNGVLTDCKSPTAGDLCVDVVKSEYGPVTFLKGKTYRVSYFEKKACGRTSNIAQYEVKVQ